METGAASDVRWRYNADMRTLSGFTLALVAATGLLAQNRSGFINPGGITRVTPSVIYPGGTSAIPGVQRTTGSVLYPGGGGPTIGVPASVLSTPVGLRNGQPFGGGFRQGGRRNGGAAFAYPVYYPLFVGSYGYGYGGYDPYAEGAAPPVQQQQPNITVIMPPPAPPVVINQFGTGAPPGPPPQALAQPAPPVSAPEAQPAPSEPTGFLIAFKDHTIYSAIAYWVDGDTLHYFTAGNTHNQASLSLIDRELTERLNRESGIDLKLPPPK